MKIALITNGIWPYVIGGMQKHSYYLCKFLAQKGIYVDVYHSFQNKNQEIEKSEYFTENEKKYLRFITITFPTKDKFLGHYLRNSKRYSKLVLATFLQQSPADFVYIQGFSGWELMLAKQKGAAIPPTLLNYHGLEMFQVMANIKGKLEAFMFRPAVKENLMAADFVQSLGGKLTGIIENVGVPKQKIIELGIGVSEDWLYHEKISVNPVRKFVFVGRYERRKGIEELTAVLAQNEYKTPFEFHFIGAIPSEKQLKRENIIYHGQIKDQSYIQSLLQSADILVCPSYAEGMPTVILEAMASGCAIIATDVGAVSATVDSTNGWLLPKPDVQLLAQAIQDALSCDAQKLISYKEKSIEKVKAHFLWENVIHKLLSYITQNQQHG